jgi:hypothetical protein
MILTASDVVKPNTLEAYNFGRYCYIRTVLMMLALLDIIESVLLSKNFVHERVKAKLTKVIQSAAINITLLSLKQ